MRAFFHRNALLVILAVVCIVAGVAFVVTTTGQHAEASTQGQEIAKLDAQMQSKLTAAKSEQQSVVNNALGTNAQRVVSDTELIRQFVRTVSTWKNSEEYNAARESVMRKYKLEKNSQVLTTYFPEPVFNTDSSGNKVYLVDADGLNSALASIDVKVLGVSGTQYKYMVLANISSSSNDRKAGATRTSVIYLTLDGEGVMSMVSGFASVSDPLSSK